MNNQLSKFEVTDRKSFVTFLDLLRKDFSENPEEWENKSLEDFLDALSSYAEDIQGYYDNMKMNIDVDQPNWKTFAHIIMGARIYE